MSSTPALSRPYPIGQLNYIIVGIVFPLLHCSGFGEPAPPVPLIPTRGMEVEVSGSAVSTWLVFGDAFLLAADVKSGYSHPARSKQSRHSTFRPLSSTRHFHLQDAVRCKVRRIDRSHGGIPRGRQVLEVLKISLPTVHRSSWSASVRFWYVVLLPCCWLIEKVPRQCLYICLALPISIYPGAFCVDLIII